VAGFCNATLGTGSNDIGGPWGIYVSPSDGNLYVADWDNLRFQVFSPFSRTGNTFFSSGVTQPHDVFVDNSSTIYITDGAYNNSIVYIQRAGVILRRIPAVGISTSSCLYTKTYTAYGITVDQSNNIYISLQRCSMVVKWAPNAINGTLVAGQWNTYGSASNQLTRKGPQVLRTLLNRMYTSL
jgi:DNA-binding beta-propeller fold protein YncE